MTSDPEVLEAVIGRQALGAALTAYDLVCLLDIPKGSELWQAADHLNKAILLLEKNVQNPPHPSAHIRHGLQLAYDAWHDSLDKPAPSESWTVFKAAWHARGEHAPGGQHGPEPIVMVSGRTSALSPEAEAALMDLARAAKRKLQEG